ncbi:MAG: FIMAH domain-containing protein [Tepidiformaceae bacterium]
MWVALDDTDVPPGAQSPALSFEAIGLPSVVTYYAGGHFPPSPYEPIEEPVPARTPREVLGANAVRGQIVGIDAIPSARSPTGLLERLIGLQAQACGDLAWITSAGVCQSLQVKLDHAQRALTEGKAKDARNHLEAFLQELEAQHGPEPGKHVTDNAYWLLKVNAEYILGRL